MAVRARLLVVCAVPVLAALLAPLLLGPPKQEQRLDFVTCDIMGTPRRAAGPCVDDFWRTPWLWTEDFYPAIGQHAKEVAARGGVPTVIHVGASDFGTDREMYRPLLEALPGSPRKLVLAEPQKGILDVLKGHAGEFETSLTSVHVINAAVATSCSGPIRMYTWSERIQEAFDRRVPLYGYVSANPHNLPNAIKSASSDKSNVWANDLRKVKHWTNLSEYVEEFTFDCITIDEMFRNVSASPSDVVSMVIDAEGEDINILRSFFQLVGFAPAFFMLEAKAYSAQFLSLWKDHLMGYTIGKTRLSSNVIGFAPGRFAWPPLQRAVWAASQLAPCGELLCPAASP